MGGFIIAIIIVGAVRSYAFRGTNSDAFTGEIVTVVFLTFVFNSMF